MPSQRIPCTRSHPGYVGDLPPDPSDAQFVALMSKIPQIGPAAAALFGGQFMQGGPVCYEDHSIDLRSNWNRIIIAASVFGGIVIIAFVLIFRKKK